MAGRRMNYSRLQARDKVREESAELERLARTVPRAPPSPWDPEPRATKTTANAARLAALKASANRMKRGGK